MNINYVQLQEAIIYGLNFVILFLTSIFPHTANNLKLRCIIHSQYTIFKMYNNN